MALPLNIEDLITGRTVEGERIEFKQGWNPISVLQTICAFANDINNWGGGYIVIGIGDKNGRPILPPTGIETDYIDKIQKELLNLCNLLKPHYFPVAEPVLFQKKHIFIIWVPGGQNRPYQAPTSLKKKQYYAYYIRRYSSTVKAQVEDVKELLSLAGTIPYDDRINHNAEIADLKLAIIQSFLKEIESDLYKSAGDMPFKQLCQQMRIVDGAAEYIKPRNVGLLFFHDLPQKYIPLSQIEIVHFKSTPGDDRLNEKIFQGPMHQQIRDALTYLKNVFLKEYIRKLPDRAEAVRFFNFPYVALEESIVNAVYHRSYEIREPVEVRIHPDRIEILSFPGPDRSIKQSDIEKGILVARRYRNRRIGEFLKELKLTEGRCTGIPKIINSMKNNGSPPPIFQTDEERTYFITLLKIHPQVKEYDKPHIDDTRQTGSSRAGDHRTNYVSNHVSNYESNKVIDRLSEQQLRILQFCFKPRKKKEIFDYIGLTNQYANYMRHIYPLIQRDFLAMTIPGNPKDRNQAYITTEAGIQYLGNTIEEYQ